MGHHKRRRRLKPKRRRPLTVYTGLKPTGGDYTSRRPGGRGLCVTIGPKEGMSAARRLGRTLIVAGNQWLWRKYTKERSDFATARDARLIILDWINDKAQHGHATYHASCFISSVRFRHDMRSVSRVVIDSSNYNNANPKFMSDTAVSGLGTAILIRHYTLVVRPHIDALITKYGKAHGYELKYMPKAQRHWVAVYLACHIAGTFYTKLIDLPKRHLAFPATGIEFAAAQGAYQCAQVLATSLGCKYGQPFLQLGS